MPEFLNAFRSYFMSLELLFWQCTYSPDGIIITQVVGTGIINIFTCSPA